MSKSKITEIPIQRLTLCEFSDQSIDRILKSQNTLYNSKMEKIKKLFSFADQSQTQEYTYSNLKWVLYNNLTPRKCWFSMRKFPFKENFLKKKFFRGPKFSTEIFLLRKNSLPPPPVSPNFSFFSSFSLYFFLCISLLNTYGWNPDRNRLPTMVWILWCVLSGTEWNRVEPLCRQWWFYIWARCEA